MSGDSSEEKTEKPTIRKTKQARDDGNTLNVPTGNKVVAFLSVVIVISFTFYGLASEFIDLFDSSFVSINGLHDLLDVSKAFYIFILKFLIILFVSMFFPLLIFSIVLKGGFNLSFKPLLPRYARVSPATNLQNIYGSIKISEVFFDFVKLLIWLGAGFALYIFLIKDIYQMIQCGLSCQFEIIYIVSIILMMMMIIYSIVIVMLEIPLEKKNFIKNIKMTKSEVKQEQKSQYGDPQVRRKRREMNEFIKRNTPVGPEYATVAVQARGATISVRYSADEFGVPFIVDIARKGRAGVALKKARNAGAHVVMDHRYGVMLMNKSVGDILNDENEYMPIIKAMFEGPEV